MGQQAREEKERFMAEGFDLRRFLLLSPRKWWVLLLGMVEEPVYRSDTLYYITFTEGRQDVTQLYYNDYTWNDVLDSDVVAGVAATMAGGITKEQIAAATRIPTMSDIRMFHVYVEDPVPETAEQIQNAIGVALAHFAGEAEGFESIVQWDRTPAEIVREHDLTGRWLICGAVLGALAALLIVLYIYVMEDTVRLESDLYHIAGMKGCIVGSLFAGKEDSREKERLKRLLAERIAGAKNVVAVQPDGRPADSSVAETVKKLLPQGTGSKKAEDAVRILCIPAGKYGVKRIGREWAAAGEKKPAAVLLYGVEYRLHKAYYFGRGRQPEEKV